jgi:hypothetical protein
MMAEIAVTVTLTLLCEVNPLLLALAAAALGAHEATAIWDVRTVAHGGYEVDNNQSGAQRTAAGAEADVWRAATEQGSADADRVRRVPLCQSVKRLAGMVSNPEWSSPSRTTSRDD